MKCILLTVAMAQAQVQCHKLGLIVENIVLNKDRSGLVIECKNSDTWERMYFGYIETKSNCIQFKE